MKMITSFFVIIAFYCSASAQEPAVDKCHVYLVDQSPAAIKALQKELESDGNIADIEKRLVRILGTFNAKVAEEEDTSRSFLLPGTKRYVTATVFYTDESMASEKGSDSILLSLAISKKPLPTALGNPDSVTAEASYNRFSGKVRIKKVIYLNGTRYLLGLECDCARNKD